MRRAALLLMLLGGCSATIDESCPAVVNRGWTFEFCQGGERAGTWAIFTDEAWREVEAVDEILDALGMELIAPHLDGAEVRIHDQPDGTGLAGRYMGYHERAQWPVDLFLPTDTPRRLARDTALAHELWHGYEHNILSVPLHDVTRSPGHFYFDETAAAVLGAAASPDGCGFFETYWGD